jgi:putative phosphoribosyl transferase
MVRFIDRKDAANLLVEHLQEFLNQKNCVVIGLARGGIILASEIAKKLNIEWDFICPKKISNPNFEEYGVGAITEDGDLSLDQFAAKEVGLGHALLNQILDQKKQEAINRANLYRKYLKKVNVENKIVILVDDGIATGHTLLACIASLKRQKAKKIIAAVPVVAVDAFLKIENKLDQAIVLLREKNFQAVGEFYQKFDQVTDDEIITLLKSIV